MDRQTENKNRKKNTNPAIRAMKTYKMCQRIKPIQYYITVYVFYVQTRKIVTIVTGYTPQTEDLSFRRKLSISIQVHIASDNNNNFISRIGYIETSVNN